MSRLALAGALVAACLAAAAVWLVPASASAGAACGAPGYTYAGLASAGPANGAAATLVAVSRPQVASGHVAAWVGVGGLGAGPGGANEWLQAGVATYADSRSVLYYELVKPGTPRRYVELETVASGERHRVAVVQLRPDRWEVRVDGRVAGHPVLLPGSNRWRAIATAESWAAGRSACNRYAYRFDALGGARSWERLPQTGTVRRSAESFLAVA